MGAIVRPATRADIEALLAIMGNTPSDEQIGLSGNKRRAGIVRRKFNEILFAPESLPGTAIVIDDGDPVGLIKLGEEADAVSSPALVWMALRVFGPIGIVGLLGRLRARKRVDFQTPPDALHIAEVHVREDARGKGYGELLLRYAEEQAIARNCPRLSLTTTTANRARHLYERFGFTIAGRKTDADFQRYTGIEGRILMVMDVGPRSDG
jgi:ribosomal protein S18 acetylase RimI-like enzyme